MFLMSHSKFLYESCIWLVRMSHILASEFSISVLFSVYRYFLKNMNWLSTIISNLSIYNHFWSFLTTLLGHIWPIFINVIIIFMIRMKFLIESYATLWVLWYGRFWPISGHQWSHMTKRIESAIFDLVFKATSDSLIARKMRLSIFCVGVTSSPPQYCIQATWLYYR